MKNTKNIIFLIIAVLILAIVLIVMIIPTQFTNDIEENQDYYLDWIENENLANDELMKEDTLIKDMDKNSKEESEMENKEMENKEECSSIKEENKKTEEKEECLTVIQQNEQDESGSEPTKEDIEQVEIVIKEMKEQVKMQINDYDSFVYAIKECFYQIGVMEKEVICLNKITHNYNDNVIYISMYVGSQTLRYFDVIYDNETQNYYVSIT